MKNWSLVTKQAVNRQHQNPGRPKPTHNPPNNFPQHQNQPKGRMYASIQITVEYERDFKPKTYMYTWILAKNLRVYANFGQKPAYLRDF